MKAISLSVVIAALGFAGSSFADQKPDVEIVDVRGYGSGCTVDDEGKPNNWSIVTNNDIKAIQINFDNFIVEGSKDAKKRKKNCKIRMYIKYPQGHTIFDFKSRLNGLAITGDDESVKVSTRIDLPKQKDPDKIVFSVGANHDDDWSTELRSFKGKQKAPCGGGIYPVGLYIDMEIDAKTDASMAQIMDHEGRYTGLDFKLRKCD